MECIITIKEDNGSTTKHNVIDFSLIAAMDNFCTDYGYKLTNIVAVVVIDP